ncbi:MAG: metalloprotease [Candidatus Altiarchaeales archaeon]|nr:metalloprotease [Candidatus Altiarchaeales archaeon]
MMESSELFDLAKAWLALSIAFAILLSTAVEDYPMNFIIALFTVGTGFVFHELAHKLTAQRFGVAAAFKSFDHMLALAILMSFAGFILAAPGAVMIEGGVGRRENGIISSAGIAANIVAATFFLILSTLTTEGIVNAIGSYGLLINSWLALFNLIPFGGFDGRKVFEWNRIVYVLLALGGLTLLLS